MKKRIIFLILFVFLFISCNEKPRKIDYIIEEDYVYIVENDKKTKLCYYYDIESLDDISVIDGYYVIRGYQTTIKELEDIAISFKEDDMVATTFVKKGQEIELKDRSRKGYSFDGYYVNDIKLKDNERFWNDTIIECRFIANTYKIIINDQEIQVTYGEEIKFPDLTKEGYNLTLYLENEVFTQKNYYFDHNITLKPVYEKINYQITVNSLFGTKVFDYSFGEVVENILVDEQPGFLFQGLYFDEKYQDEVLFPLEIKDNLQLYCKYLDYKDITLQSFTTNILDNELENSNKVLNLQVYPQEAKDFIIVSISSDTEARLEEGIIYFGSPGTVRIIVSCFDVTLVKEVNVIAPEVKINIPTVCVVTDLINCDYQTNYDGYNYVWSVKNARYTDGIISFSHAGTSKIKIYAKEKPEVYDEVTITVVEGNKRFFISNTNSESLVVNGFVYQKGKTLFNTITDCLNNISEKANIYVDAMNITEQLVVDKNNINIFGNNYLISGINHDKQPTSYNNLITIKEGVSDVRIEGFSFSGDIKIVLEGANNNITIINNTFVDTTQSKDSWVETKDYKSGIITITEGKTSDGIIIEGNYFKNINDVGVNYSTTLNFKAINNTFENFTYDAIRSTNGVVSKSCQWLFMENTFINGEYNGLFFRTYGSDSEYIEHVVTIFDNKFINVGKKTVNYSGAISFRNYQEGLTSVNIRNNEFVNCNNYIFLRNNAKSTNHKNFYGIISYNSFIGLPKTYLLTNKNASDTENTNPNNIILNYNYFGSESSAYDAQVIAKYIDGAKENTNIFSDINELNAKPKVLCKNYLFLDSNQTVYSEKKITISSQDQNLCVVENNTVIPKNIGNVNVVCKDENGEEVILFFIVRHSISKDFILELIRIAEGELGYHEGPNNDTKYGTWYGLPNQPWCAMYVSWCAMKAGIPTSIIPKYASVQIGMDWFKNKNQFGYKGSYTPKAGDLIFFKSDGASHTGIVISCDGTKVYTIEGNTSDICAKRSYSLSYSKITGYGIPAYPQTSNGSYNFDVSGATSGDGLSTI